MSFTNDVKHELCACDVPDDLREKIRYGLFYGFRGNDEHYFITHDKTAAGYARRLFPKNTVSYEQHTGKTGTSYQVTAADRLFFLKYSTPVISRSLIGGSDAEVGAFLRGAFLSCGNVYVQKAGYHLELSAGTDEKCEELHQLINEQGMNISVSHRGSSYFLYSKNSEDISDILTFMGAVQCAMEIMNIKIIKEVRSGINRSVNCETANIERTVRASSKQLDDIKLILENAEPGELSDDLREIAVLRMNNPDMSLRDLGKLANPSISRSGVNHRFERIAKLAGEIRERQRS